MEMPARERPRLRPVEAIPDREHGRVILRDPTQLAAGMLVVGETELFLLSLLDGERRRLEIQSEYARVSGRLLLSHEFDALLDQLDEAGYLAGAGFESYYAGLVEEFRALPYRPLRSPDGLGAPLAELPAYLDTVLDAAEGVDGWTGGRMDDSGASALLPFHPSIQPRLRAIVAPHLDFPRGRRAYAAGYRQLREAARAGAAPRRVVVLGTNHFGRSGSVVVTTKDFETPWGVVETDREFLGRLQAACGGNLMPYELDHLREHSIELQAVWLRHVLGEEVRIVPVLCPDPSGLRGTAPRDPGGVDLRRFARELGRLVREDPEPTLLVGSADLSHVGGYFGDRIALDDEVLAAVRKADETGLSFVAANDPDGLREHMADTENPTRWCSIGCLYAMMTALGPTARAQPLDYHQAVLREQENCVTCAAFAFHDAE
jgi:MEMO1 family protein